MSKEQLRYFFASFAISILLYLGMMGIFVADVHSRARGFGDDNALLLVERTGEDQANITWLGKDYTLDTGIFTDIREVVYPFRTLIPIRYRFIPDLISYAGGLDWQQVLPF